MCFSKRKNSKKPLDSRTFVLYNAFVSMREVSVMYLSESDLNGIGRDIVRSFSTDEFEPVDIEDLLKKLLGISVEDYTLHPRGLILGMCSNQSQLVKVKKDREIILAELNKNVVFIDSSLNDPWHEGRRNFTIIQNKRKRLRTDVVQRRCCVYSGLSP